MAHFLRGKQAGIQNDFSAAVEPDFFMLDDLRRIGISSRISQLAYDPVQSLLAVGTTATTSIPGQIYIFGQKRISATFPLARSGSSVRLLQFCSDKLLCLDSKNDFHVYSLLTKTLIIGFSPPGIVTALVSDPTLDYVFLGMQNGELLAYDIDRECLAPFRLPCFWSEVNPRARTVSVVSLEFHPRDIGTLLIGYTEGAVIYSFKQNKSLKSFHYHVPRGAPGGDADPASINIARIPKLTQAIWHPTGTFVLTGHEDSSIVVWDPRDGRVIMARTLSDTNVDQPGGGAASLLSSSGTYIPKTRLLKIAWCANQDPDDTGILVAGGTSALLQTRGLTFFELGRTPVYATSPWATLSDHFGNPKRQHILPTPPNVEVINFCLIPRKTPWFAGAHDPVAILALLSSGEVATLSFPTGFPISPTNQLPLSMTFIHPFINCIAQASVERNRWLGMTETRPSGPKILNGGAEAPRPLKRFEDRSIIQTAHADGTVRLWDVGHGDEIENELLVQADVARAVGRIEDVHITCLSFSGASGELAAGLKSGEVIIFRWSRNNRPGQEPPPGAANQPQALTNITDRRDPGLTEGFHPLTLLHQQNGPVSALKVSDVGFVAAGFEGGSIAVIDLRGPAIIFSTNMNEFLSQKHGSLRKSGVSKQSTWPTTLEFSVMTIDRDDYSSILLHAGTNDGHIATFKILPGAGGRYTVNFIGSSSADGSVHYIHPLNVSSGEPAYASQSAVANLKHGHKVDGAILAVTQMEVRLFKPPSAKGAHKSWDSVFCDSAAVTRRQGFGTALVCLFGDGTARSYTVPGLKEIGSIALDRIVDVKRLPEAIVTTSGEILAWTGPSEIAFLNVWGTGENQLVSQDIIFNPALLIPPRPTISNFQWVSGTQYITTADMDILIGGPDRPPSKSTLAQSRTDEATRRAALRAQSSISNSEAALAAVNNPAESEGYWAYMQRQLNERTEKLGIMGDSMERLEGNSAGWADDVSKFVGKQKKNLIMGAIKRGVGL